MKRIAIILFTLSLCMVPTFAVTNTTEYMNMAFWHKFNDDILVDNLIKVYENNNDLKAAVLKVNEGNRIVKMSFANELPHVGFQGYVGRIFSSSDELFGEVKIPNYAETHYLLPLTMNYEIDIWGKNEGSNTIHHAGCSSQANENSGIHAYKDENITLSNNGPKVLKQFIGERTLTYACVRFTGSSGGSGYWSPDTSGSGFPTINYL